MLYTHKVSGSNPDQNYYFRPRSVTVSTLDFESSDPSSNLGGVSCLGIDIKNHPNNNV